MKLTYLIITIFMLFALVTISACNKGISFVHGYTLKEVKIAEDVWLNKNTVKIKILNVDNVKNKCLVEITNKTMNKSASDWVNIGEWISFAPDLLAPKATGIHEVKDGTITLKLGRAYSETFYF